MSETGRGSELLALAEAGVRRAKALGADEAEVYAVDHLSARVEFRGRLGDVQENAEGGYSVRVAVGKRTGFAGHPGLGDESLERALGRALSNARASPEDPRFRHYAHPIPVSAPPTRIDARVAYPEGDRLLGDAKDAASGVAGQDDVTYLAFQLWASSVTFGVANGRGVAAWDQDARESFLSEMRLSRGGLHKTSNEFGVERAPLSERHDLAGLLGDAASRARGALDVKPLPRVVDTVVFDPVTTMQITGPFLENLATAAAKKEGLSTRVGQSIASHAVTLRDTPHRANGARCQRVDDEGVPTRETTIIERGVLRTLTRNAYIAHQGDEPSTGNGYRPFDNRWSSSPKARLASVDLVAGSRSVADMLADVDHGIYVRDYLLGYFTNNPVTGDFSTVAPLAFLVEKGSIVQALPPTTVAGNVFRLMESVRETSRETRTLLRGTFPTIRVDGLTCATQ